ncbi:MAG TPA: DUF2851 family protein [Bacteroidia bacterium]|nr:DUF2851 family protein [Bacteroidia bacterium]
MTEDLLHFIWKYKLLKPVPLYATSNAELQITKYGEHNTNAGPDFNNARIKLADTEWAGTIEIHKKSSDWFLHNHHTNKAYDNVILHVVYEHDKEIYNSKEQPIPCFELKHFLQEGVLTKYENLHQNKQSIPCGTLFNDVPDIIKEPWLERVLVERLETKTSFIQELFTFTKNNWDETFYLLLCKNFGFHINSDAFLQLGKSIPLTTLLKHTNAPAQIEALLFGQSGLLHKDLEDKYAQSLFKEYTYLKHKYQLTPIPHNLKFLRLRPLNFPTIRLAQLANFSLKYQHTFSKIVEASSVKEVKDIFSGSVSDYWKTHYTFDEESIFEEKAMGKSSIENIIINTVCPLLFFYGKMKQDESLMEKAVKWYYELKPEKNNITKLFEELSFKSKHAGHSQALIQLNNNYCSQKKCLQCSLGVFILSKK